MPGYGAPFPGLANERKLTSEKSVRAIRSVVASEYDAVQNYTQFAESNDNKSAMAVLNDIADEVRVHAGEFPKLPYYLAPDEAKLTEQGAKEVDAIIKEAQMN